MRARRRHRRAHPIDRGGSGRRVRSASDQRQARAGDCLGNRVRAAALVRPDHLRARAALRGRQAHRHRPRPGRSHRHRAVHRRLRRRRHQAARRSARRPSLDQRAAGRRPVMRRAPSAHHLPGLPRTAPAVRSFWRRRPSRTRALWAAAGATRRAPQAARTGEGRKVVPPVGGSTRRPLPRPGRDKPARRAALPPAPKRHVASMRSMGGHVFISYRHGHDTDYVERLAQFLQNSGISTWHDRQIVSGDRWIRLIQEKISSCGAFIPVMTPEAEDSDWVMREVTHAEKTNRPILPLLRAGEGFFRLNNLHFEDVRNGSMPPPGFVARLQQFIGDPTSGQQIVETRYEQDASQRRTGPATSSPVRGRNVEAEITLDFIDMALGCILPVTLRSPGSCETCDGTGFVAGDSCPDCLGSGLVTKIRTLRVKIPAGVKQGMRIRLAGRGEPGVQGGPNGDIELIVAEIRPHPIFGRDGDDLTMKVPISYAEAVLGAEIRLPTISGVVTLRVGPGTESGRAFRIRGKGISSGVGPIGDLLVTVIIDVPPAGSLAPGTTDAIEHIRPLIPADRTLIQNAIKELPRHLRVET